MFTRIRFTACHKLVFTLLALAVLPHALSAQSVVINGVEYREITDLNKPRLSPAQGQLGAASIRVAQYNPSNQYNSGNTVWPSRAPSAAPADQRPALNFAGQPVAPSVAAYSQPYAYGYGFANGCSWRNNAGYGNRLPPANTYPISTMQPATAQPYSAVMPLSFTNLQPAAPSVFNPYGPPQNQTPWRPLVPIRNLPTNYEVGQGIIGQPKVYIPNQPVRNFIRYITP